MVEMKTVTQESHPETVAVRSLSNPPNYKLLWIYKVGENVEATAMQ